MIESKIHRKTFATVDIKNFKHNTQLLKEMAGDLFYCPMVKSNAYGHGDKEIVKALTELNITDIGVALIEEALRIRNYGFKDINILIFGAIKVDDFQVIINNNLTPVITNWFELEEFSKLELNSYPVHIKFNTGMNRFGFSSGDAEQVSIFLKKSKVMKLAGVGSHFYDGENINDQNGSSHQQLIQFQEILQFFPNTITHMYNSSSYLNLQAENKDDQSIGSRLGLALYGSYPNSNYKQQNFAELKPVMSLQSEVVEYQKLKVGDKVSYSGTWEAERPSIIGIVPIGYTDGYGREFSNKGQMIYRGQLVKVIGKICMDYTMVDLTDVLINEVGIIGEEIVLFGKQGNLFIGVEEFAESVNKIPYEILTTLGRRVPRNYIYE